MTTSNIYSRVWFETIDAGRENISTCLDSEETAAAAIMIEVQAGRFEVDMKKAIIAELRKVDAAHGRAADALLAKIAAGNTPLVMQDLELVVTLGGGRRKTWFYVNADDLDAMNDIRYRNYRSARDSFQEFNGNVIAVRPIVSEFGTLGAAFEAGAFSQEREAA